jgi:hypothetical protein
MKFFMLREAIASVAIEHDPRCRCVVCRAADGDQKAFLEIWLESTGFDDEPHPT